MTEQQIVQTALFELMRQNGMAAGWKARNDEIDGEMDLVIQEQKVHFYVEVKKELRQHQLPKILEMARKYTPFMVIADNIFPTLKQVLRHENIAYLDTAGNIYVKTKEVFIWIDAHKPVVKEKTGMNRAFSKTGLKMVFYLLQNEGAINLPYRHLAAETGVALGNVKNIIDGLREAGFILQLNANTLRIQNKKGLLERWITGYEEVLKPAILLGRYRFSDENNLANWKGLAIETGIDVWGGEPAAEHYTNYLTPGALTLYTKQPKVKIMTKWRLIPDPNGYVGIYEIFWNKHEGTNEVYAPPLLVYTDLLLTDDPRCIETAEKLYNQYLKNEFK